MQRHRLPPIDRSGDEAAAAALKELRAELAALEAVQKASEQEVAETELKSRTTKKAKSVLARRLLEQSRLHALQQRHDEANERAGKVEQFNRAMQQQAAAHIERVVAHRRAIPTASSEKIIAYSLRANMELAVLPGESVSRQRPHSGNTAAASSSLRKELVMLRDLTRELVRSTATGSASVRRTSNEVTATAEETVRRPSNLDATMLIHFRPPATPADLQQQRAEARLAILEDHERQQARADVLRIAGTLPREEALVDGVVLRHTAEANIQAAMQRREAAKRGQGSVAPQVSQRRAEVTKDEQRELAAYANREKLQRALEEQRGQLDRLRDRLAQLEGDQEHDDAEKAIGEGDVFQFAVEEVAAPEPAPDPPVLIEAAPPAKTRPETKADDTSSRAEAPSPASQDVQVVLDPQPSTPAVTSAPVVSSNPCPVDHTLAIAAQVANEVGPALSRMHGRLISALYREVLIAEESRITASVVVTSFLRARLSALHREQRRLGNVSASIHPHLRAAVSTRHVALRVRLYRRPGGTFADVAATAIQSQYRRHVAESRYRSAKHAAQQQRRAQQQHDNARCIQSAFRAYRGRRHRSGSKDMRRQHGRTVIRAEAATLISSVVKGFLSRKRITPRLAQRRGEWKALMLRSAEDFAIDPDFL
jgi:hypothetical protein